LARDLDLNGPPAAALRDLYGARPKEQFITEAWPTLLEEWLARERKSRVAVVEELRSRGLGAAGVKVKTAAEQVGYLRSCRNATTLRKTVLTELILAGEADLAPVPNSKPPAADSPQTRVENVDVGEADGDTPSLKDFVDQTFRSVLQISELQRDDDGDIPVRSGSSMLYVRVQDNDDKPSLVIFICPLLTQVARSPELLDSLNEINLQITLGRVVLTEDRVALEAEILADTLSPVELRWAFDYVRSAADYFDSKLAARFGGTTMFSEEEEHGVEV